MTRDFRADHGGARSGRSTLLGMEVEEDDRPADREGSSNKRASTMILTDWARVHSGGVAVSG